MVTVHLSSVYTVKIPSNIFAPVYTGLEVAVSEDALGRLIITPFELVRAALNETFGMWADRKDILADGVDYLDQIRRGRRLDDLGLRNS